MVVTTPLTVVPPPTCDNYEAKSAFWDLFDSTMTLTFDLLIPAFDVHSSLPQSPLLVKVWSNSINKYVRYLVTNVCLGLTHGQTDAHNDAWTLWKHNVSLHHIGGGMEINVSCSMQNEKLYVCLVAWSNGTIVGCFNKVTVCRARLVLRWVTITRYIVLVCNQES